MPDFSKPPQADFGAQTPRSTNPIWWILGGCGTLMVLGCCGCAGFLMYVGAYGPETSVYPGDEVPSHFTDEMKEVGALEEGEQILFFYSDGFTDILEGFYFVSDQRVVIYSELAPGEPLTSISFDEIAELEIYRDESFLDDSEITLILDSGEYVFIPVSSEQGRDRKFFDAIKKRAPDAIVNE